MSKLLSATAQCSYNKPSLHLPYKTHSYKNMKGKKHAHLLFLQKTKVEACMNGIEDADIDGTKVCQARLNRHLNINESFVLMFFCLKLKIQPKNNQQ